MSLDSLDYCHGRIMEVKLSEHKDAVFITEACDNYFYVEMGKTEFGNLIADLQAIHNTMIED